MLRTRVWTVLWGEQISFLGEKRGQGGRKVCTWTMRWQGPVGMQLITQRGGSDYIHVQCFTRAEDGSVCGMRESRGQGALGGLTPGDLYAPRGPSVLRCRQESTNQ
jgi:hypothetical protein